MTGRGSPVIVDLDGTLSELAPRVLRYLVARLGDADSLACAKRLAASSDAAVADAAKAAVARWPKPKEDKK